MKEIIIDEEFEIANYLVFMCVFFHKNLQVLLLYGL